MSSSNRTSINPNELSNPRSSRFGYQNLENEETTVVPRLSISDGKTHIRSIKAFNSFNIIIVVVYMILDYVQHSRD